MKKIILLACILLVAGCGRNLHVSDGDPKLGTPMNYQIQETYTVCDDAGTKDAGCETIESILLDYSSDGLK